ncbi:MAG: ATP-binding protein [Eubacteriales bacterium]|nr:ATP-binding protein [Eubacteriales bacterium]
MKLAVLFSASSRPLSGGSDWETIRDAVKECFIQAYGTDSDLQIGFGEANAPGYDVVLAFDAYPNIGFNPIQKRNQFRDGVARRLYELLPRESGYAGRVAVCLEKEIRRAAPQSAGTAKPSQEPGPQEEYRSFAREFTAEEPKFTFDRLVLAEDVRQRILEQICILENRDKLFREWGLAAIASPSVLLNLYGDSGTGKSMAAEAIANRLGKKILRVSYADIESKYHGEGPKRLKGIFLAATEQDAVLFIDEADSLLSARLSNVTQGSEQAINSMRSQLLISLENHDGIVIFATNLIENYDKAFRTRLLSVEMKRPDAAQRRQIWYNHLYPVGEGRIRLNIPLAQDIDLEKLAGFDFCGRDIRNAVKQACVAVVVRGGNIVCQEDLMCACERIEAELKALARASAKVNPGIRPLAEEEENKITQQLKQKLAGKKAEL